MPAGTSVAHFVSLPCVAAIGEPSHEAAVVRNGVGVELCDGLLDELVEPVGQLWHVEAPERVALRGHELVLEIGREQPRRSEDARVRRHEHARDLELEGDVAREQRPRAAGGDERELARVVAAPHRVELDRLGHSVLLDLKGAERRLLDRHPELVRDRAHRLLGKVAVERHCSAEKPAVGAEAAQDELRVRGGRQRAAPPVARRPRVGTGGLGADAEHAALVDVRDRAAPGADRVDVDHRHHRLVVADLRIEQVAHSQLTAGGDADVGGGAADVERDHVVEARHAACPDATDEPRDRA